MRGRFLAPSRQGVGRKLALAAACLFASAFTPATPGALPLLPAPAGSAKAPARPNIVVLVADDWSFTDVGAFGGEIATPNIDALAARGTRFANFHVAGSCAPTRAMLQTGLPNHRIGLGNMPETIPPEHQGKPGYAAELDDGVVTIADRLRATGYRTYQVGKWHLGNRPANLPTGKGYDRAFALGQSGADNFENKPNLLLYKQAAWTEDGKPATLPNNFYSSRFIIDKTIEYVDAGRPSGKPFLASVNFLANHIPVQAPDADIAAYKGRYAAGWTALRASRRAGAIAAGMVPADTPMVSMDTTADWNALTPAEKAQRAHAMAAYGGMATAMDREIGRLVAHLKATGQYDNTVFVFLSDNGPEAIDPGIGAFNNWAVNHYYNTRPDQQGRPGSFTAIGTSFASALAAPFRGYKFSASEGGTRVPLIIAWPGNPALPQGGVARGFAHVTDIAPTLLALAGVAAPAGAMTGRDLSPLLTGAASVHPADEAIGYELSGNAVVWKGDWKLVKNLPPYGDGRWALYDIAADPGETRDLAAAEPARSKLMQADYAAYAARDRVLAMPAGYSAPQQVEANAKRDRLYPQLRELAVWVAGGLGLVIGGVVAFRRRRRQPG
jgi:arylsulfatase A-like enzyme